MLVIATGVKILNEFIHSLIDAFAVAVVGVSLGSVGVLFWMWIDVRSLKKAMNAAFDKIRNLEDRK